MKAIDDIKIKKGWWREYVVEMKVLLVNPSKERKKLSININNKLSEEEKDFLKCLRDKQGYFWYNKNTFPY